MHRKAVCATGDRYPHEEQDELSHLHGMSPRIAGHGYSSKLCPVPAMVRTGSRQCQKTSHPTDVAAAVRIKILKVKRGGL